MTARTYVNLSLPNGSLLLPVVFPAHDSPFPCAKRVSMQENKIRVMNYTYTCKLSTHSTVSN